MSIEERAKKHAFKTYYTQQGKRIGEESYIAGATEQQALSEARIKELEEALETAISYIKCTGYEDSELESRLNKALNNQQQ